MYNMSCPPKYLKIGDFQDYYNGSKVAPCLTIFIGGNHEASNYLREKLNIIHIYIYIWK